MDAVSKPVTDSIDPATIARVYSGKPGCGCGCRGKYYETPAMITRVVNQINDNLADAKQDDAGLFGGTIYSFETDRRYLWAYTKDA